MRVDAKATKRTYGLICLALGLITLALYLPAVRFDFLSYDDQQYITENSHVQAGLTVNSLVWAFGFHAGNWHPLTWISHMVDCQLYGLHPAGHHLTNVLLHTANTILLFLVLSRMTGVPWRSAVVAALFGWHPLHVESVAWIAERKDVLSAFFFMLTLLAYAKYVSRAGSSRGHKENPNSHKEQHDPSELSQNFPLPIGWGEGSRVRGSVHWQALTDSGQAQQRNIEPPYVGCYDRCKRSGLVWYIASLFLFALGLMSKPMLVTLPFLLLLLDFWPLGRLRFPITNYQLFCLFLEKIPFFVLAAVVSILTFAAQSRVHAVVSTAGLPIATRVSHAVVSYAHYITAMFFPRHLAVYYPYETVIPSVQVLGAAFALVLISLAAIRFIKKSRYLFVGWFWFIGMLVPVIGLVQVGEQAWADRYVYLPSIGLFVAAVWGTGELVWAHSHGAVRTPRPTIAGKVGRGVLTAPFVATALLGSTLLILTSIQLRYWRNTRTLFEHTAAVTHKNYMAVTLLGSLDAKEGKFDEAIARYKIALAWKPDYPEADFFLGNALDQQGKLDDAILQYQKALWFKPMQEQTHIFLGAAFAKQGKHDDAIGQYLAALKLNPESAVAHNNLAHVFQTKGRLDEAIEHYTAALKFDPGLAQAHNNLGVLLLSRGKTTEGIRELREALRLNPGNLESQYNLALALNQQQQWSEAADLLGKILEKRGNDANAHFQFAAALVHLQRTREAMSHYASALLLNPDFPDALDGLAWILATAPKQEFRNGPEALTMAKRACALTGRKDAQKLKTLAAAYAEVGQYEDAGSTLQSAIDALGRADISVLKELQAMAETFTSHKPWRAPETK